MKRLPFPAPALGALSRPAPIFPAARSRQLRPPGGGREAGGVGRWRKGAENARESRIASPVVVRRPASATLFPLLLLLLALPFSASCSRRPTTPLRIASHVWPGYDLMFLARREKWLPAGQVDFLETGSASESLKDLADGRADGAALTLDEVLRARDGGIPLTVVLVFDVSAGADQVLAREGIETLADLRGRRIGAEESALGALMLDAVLEKAGLPADAVVHVPLAIPAQLDAWKQGKVDAVVTYEPMASHLRHLGAHLLADSRSLPATILDVLAIRPEAMRSHPDAVRALVAAHFRALKHLRGNPWDAAYRMAGRAGSTAQEVLDAYRGLELPDVGANRRYLGGDRPTIVPAASTLSSVLLHAGLIRQPARLDRLVDAGFLPPVEEP